VILLTLVGATALIAREASRSAAALRVAETERTRATRITEFLLGVFRATNPNETRGRTVTARELLDQAAARIRRDLAREPKARADLELAIGRAYGLVGLTHTADTIITRLVADLRARTPVDSLALANALEHHGRTGAVVGRLREGVAIMREVIAIRERKLGPNAPELASPYQRLGVMAESLDPLDRDSLAGKSLDRALALYRGADTLDTRSVVDVLRFKATLADNAGRAADALAIMREAVATAERTTTPDDPFRFNVYETYGLYLQSNGFTDSSIARRQAAGVRARAPGRHLQPL
jgi:serine/threonine-protein kinase